MICHLLGVPYRLRAEFQSDSNTLFSLEADSQSAASAMVRLEELILEVVRTAKPDAEGILPLLRRRGELRDEEIAGVGVLLLTAGHESTTNSLALSVVALLGEKARRGSVLDDPASVPAVIEELLRYLSVFHLGVPRSPLVDVDYAGSTIRAGESVTICIPAANRDPAWCPGGAEEFDLDRRTQGHLAFGYGLHQCLGQNLVRAEMRIALPALFSCFPRMRLACPEGELPFTSSMSVYGLTRLPVLLDR